LSNVAPGIYSGVAFTGTGTSVNNKEHKNYIEITPQNTANVLTLKGGGYVFPPELKNNFM
jgi:hypothetical protein